jgi:hypothetical protein
VFLNRVILEVIDPLLENSPVPPVIIVQGDHGWTSPPPPSFGSSQLFDHGVRSRAGILNAFRVPASVERKLYPDITPVNTFRMLFAELFAAEIDLLPDRSYYSGYAAPLLFLDATDRLREAPQ